MKEVTRDSFLDSLGNADPQKSVSSGLGVGVPGTVAGLAFAHRKYGSGKFTLAQLIAPSIALARDGLLRTPEAIVTLAASAALVLLGLLRPGPSWERLGIVPVVSGLKRISKPGLRVYARKTDIPRVLGGMGTTIMSTSGGIMTGHEATKKGLGGEIWAEVW